MKTIATKIAFAAAALSLATTGYAAETQQRTTGVSYTDLDLSTDEGKAELDNRIERAAQEVCGLGEHELGTRVRSRDARECYQNAKRQLDRHFAQVKREAATGA